MHNKTKLRIDIEALRGLSVILVILYHFKLENLNYQVIKGGFIGVDIFDKLYQQASDENRDNATEKAKWKRAIRIKTKDWHKISEKLNFFKELENEEYFKKFLENYEQKIQKNLEVGGLKKNKLI